MSPSILLVLACAGDPAPAPAPTPAPAAADPAALVALLQGPLAVPPARLGRLQARIGPDCAVVLDPADPAGCDITRDCMATTFTAEQGTWRVSSMAHTGSLPEAHRCPRAGALGPLPGLAD